eukprot:3578997-Rhodomonas_salina.1
MVSGDDVSLRVGFILDPRLLVPAFPAGDEAEDGHAVRVDRELCVTAEVRAASPDSEPGRVGVTPPELRVGIQEVPSPRRVPEVVLLLLLVVKDLRFPKQDATKVASLASSPHQGVRQGQTDGQRKMSEKTLVVIGAGNAGVSLVNELADVPNLKVVVLELKDHFDMTIGNPRAISNEAYASEVLWEWDKVLNGSPEVVQVQQVQEISDGGVRVVLANKQTSQIKADGVVVATGSKYNSSWMKNNEGLNKDEWLAKMTQLRAAIANAKHVMVIGGGVTGVEVAGEIATEFDAKVTVVHKGAWLMNTSESVHRTTMAAIEAVPGTIDVVFNDTVDATETLGEAGPKSYTTAKGRKIEDVSV